MKADDALSEVARQNVQEWFFNTLRGRANSDRTRFLVVMQRLHEDDLAGHLLRQGGRQQGVRQHGLWRMLSRHRR